MVCDNTVAWQPTNKPCEEEVVKELGEEEEDNERQLKHVNIDL